MYARKGPSLSSVHPALRIPPPSRACVRPYSPLPLPSTRTLLIAAALRALPFNARHAHSSSNARHHHRLWKSWSTRRRKRSAASSSKTFLTRLQFNLRFLKFNREPHCTFYFIFVGFPYLRVSHSDGVRASHPHPQHTSPHLRLPPPHYTVHATYPTREVRLPPSTFADAAGTSPLGSKLDGATASTGPVRCSRAVCAPCVALWS